MPAAAPPRTPSHAAIVAAALLLGAVTVAWRVLTFSGFNNDHYIYLAGAQQMLLGEWPVRDFVDPGWPLMNAVSAAARYLFGSALLVELMVVAVALAIGAACTVSAAARLSGSLTIAVIVAALEVVINPRSFGYPKVLLYAVAAWVFVRFVERPARRGIVMLAALTACAFLFRHDHGLYIGVGACVAAAGGFASQGGRAAARAAGLFGVALAVMLLPWAAYVYHYVGFVDYFVPALEFSRAEAEATLIRSLPRLAVDQSVLSRDNSGLLLFYLFHAIPVLCVPIAISLRRREHWSGETVAVVAIAAMAVPANFGFLRSPLLARVPDAVVPAAILGAWLLGLTFRAQGRAWRGLAFAAAGAAVVVTAVAVGSMADLGNELNRVGILNRPGSFSKRVKDLEARLPRTRPEGNQLPSRNAVALLPVLDYITRCSAANDRLVMTGLSPDIYVLANRGFAGGQMAFRPNFYARDGDQRRALDRMHRQSVPFFVLSLEEEHDFREHLPLIAAYLDERYAVLGDVDVPDTRGLRVFAERGRKAVIDPATGWPCFSDSLQAGHGAPGLQGF